MTKAPEYRHYLDRFRKKVNAITSSIRGPLPLDPRFNSVHWLFDCQALCNQIEHSASKMREFCIRYRADVRPGERMANIDPHVSYYADNVVIRLLALRDKLALCVWAYFCPFRPFDSSLRLNLRYVLDYLTRPAQYRIPVAAASSAHQVLSPLARFPRTLKQYRDMKIHGREPRVELYKVQPHHDWPYVVPVETEKEERVFESQLARAYDAEQRKFIRRTSRIRGTLYRRLSMEENARLISYSALEKSCLQYRATCYRACDQVASFLRRRGPFRKRKRSRNLATEKLVY